MRLKTALIHGNNHPDKSTGSTLVPIYQNSSYGYGTAEELAQVFAGREAGFVYSRLGNPTVAAFEARINGLEKGVGAVACASGMAAIVSAILNVAGQGSEIIASSGIFGGTYALFNNLKDYGITPRFTEDADVESIGPLINARTRAIFIETIGNPKLDVPDIARLAKLAHDHGIVLIVDSTVTSPCLIRPIELGADLVIHSTSKYINGSGNSIGGVVIDSGRFPWPEERYPALQEYKKNFGPNAFLAKLRKNLLKDMGFCLAPFNAYLNSLGLETLSLRMEQACLNAHTLAGQLASHPKVKGINYPGLPDNPYHHLADSQFGGRYGAILTLRLGTKEKAFAFINSLKLFSNLANIGDTRSLIIHPASTICVQNTLEEKEAMGVYEDLVRVSLGIEDPEDLLEDILQGLKNI